MPSTTARRSSAKVSASPDGGKLPAGLGGPIRKFSSAASGIGVSSFHRLKPPPPTGDEISVTARRCPSPPPEVTDCPRIRKWPPSAKRRRPLFFFAIASRLKQHASVKNKHRLGQKQPRRWYDSAMPHARLPFRPTGTKPGRSLETRCRHVSGFDLSLCPVG